MIGRLEPVLYSMSVDVHRGYSTIWECFLPHGSMCARVVTTL